MPDNRAAIRRYRQTVYSADYTVPDWAKDVVYYYIFPERFRNGDAANDPQPGRDTYLDHGIELHDDWLDKPWVPGDADGHAGDDDQYNNDFFGGDLAGIIEKLDYLKDLGVNTLYINPIFEAASNHKYDTGDYLNVDDGFGTNAEFERLTHEAGVRGIRVILDTSLNHTGSDSTYFDRYAKHAGIGAFEGTAIRPDSPWADWYSFHPDETDPDRQYDGWIGVTSLPGAHRVRQLQGLRLPQPRFGDEHLAGPRGRRLADGRHAVGQRRVLARVADLREGAPAGRADRRGDVVRLLQVLPRRSVRFDHELHLPQRGARLRRRSRRRRCVSEHRADARGVPAAGVLRADEPALDARRGPRPLPVRLHRPRQPRRRRSPRPSSACAWPCCSR